MITIFKKLWHDPVWSKVIAGGILTAIATAAAYFLNWWPSVSAFAGQCVAFALASTPTPNWILFLLVILSLPLFIVFGNIVWERIFTSQDSSPDWRDYTADIFFGLRWRWSYDFVGGVSSKHTFCPHCDFQVFARNSNAYDYIDRIEFYCDSCQSNLGEFQESLRELESKTERFIQQKIRNGKWPTQSSV